jgi:hypothetical protein
MVKFVSPPHNLQAGGQPLVGYPRLIIQHIRSRPPYLEAVSSIRNLMTWDAAMIRDPFKMKEYDKTAYVRGEF